MCSDKKLSERSKRYLELLTDNLNVIYKMLLLNTEHSTEHVSRRVLIHSKTCQRQLFAKRFKNYVQHYTHLKINVFTC